MDLQDWWDRRCADDRAVRTPLDDHAWLMSRMWAVNWRRMARFDERALRKQLGAT